MESENTFSHVIKNRGFLNLWINQILVQLALNSLNFALIIWVFLITGSNAAVSALLFLVYLPAVLFGLFAGVLVDVTDRKKIIMAINFFTAIAIISLFFFKNHYPIILFITFFVNTLSQFYGPAESSAIPIIVKKQQLMIANSMFSTTLFSTFLVGFGAAGPLIDHFGIDYVFFFGAGLTVLAFLLSLKFPSIIGVADQEGRKLIKAVGKRDFSLISQLALSEIKKTLHLIKGKLPVVSAIGILAGVQMVVGILAVLIPGFLETVLQINASNASYILIIPLGLGMVTGGILIGKLGYLFPRRRIVGTAVSIAGLLFFIVGIAPLIAPVIQYFPKPRPLPFFYQLHLSSILAAGSFLLGIAMVSIIIPSQTVLHENTPEQDRGKVFAVLGCVMAGFSLIPVLFAGVLADILGTQPIFLALGGMIALLGLFILKPSFFFDQDHLPLHVREFLGLGHWVK